MSLLMQRIQYAKTKSDVIAKADGTFVPREKRKRHEERGMLLCSHISVYLWFCSTPNFYDQVQLLVIFESKLSDRQLDQQWNCFFLFFWHIEKALFSFFITVLLIKSDPYQNDICIETTISYSIHRGLIIWLGYIKLLDLYKRLIICWNVEFALIPLERV